MQQLPASFQKVLDVDVMPIITDDGEMFRHLIDDLLLDIFCGLTVIVEHRHDEPLVCLTTQHRIIVVKLGDRDQIKNLRAVLKRKEFTFFVMNGAKAADILRSYNIKVKNMLDLTTFDIHITLRTYFTERIPPRGKYFLSDIRECIKVKPLNYIKLAEKWLDIRLDKCSEDDFKLLAQDCFDACACDVIIKTAALTRALGIRMLEDFEKHSYARTNQILAFGARASDDAMEAFRRGENSWDCLYY